MGTEGLYSLVLIRKQLFSDVILRSKATKNLIVARPAEILRFAQNDMEVFPDGN